MQLIILTGVRFSVGIYMKFIVSSGRSGSERVSRRTRNPTTYFFISYRHNIFILSCRVSHSFAKAYSFGTRPTVTEIGQILRRLEVKSRRDRATACGFIFNNVTLPETRSGAPGHAGHFFRSLYNLWLTYNKIFISINSPAINPAPFVLY